MFRIYASDTKNKRHVFTGPLGETIALLQLTGYTVLKFERI